jgi:hypothetical protein
MTKYPALLLTAAAPWFLNSLHSAPDTGPSSRELMDAILPHVDATEADPENLPYRMSLPDLEEDPSLDGLQDDADLRPHSDVDGGPGLTNLEMAASSEEDLLEVSQMVRGDDEDSRRSGRTPPQRQEEEEESEIEELGPLRVEGEELAEDEMDGVLMERRHRRVNETVPYIPYGVIFLRPLCVGEKYPVPRFIQGPWISTRAVRYLFGMDLEVVVEKFNPPLVSLPRNEQRTRNRVQQRHKILEDVPRVFNLERKGHSLPPAPRDLGSDLEESESDLDDSSDEDVPKGLDQMLDRLLAYFWIDILEVSPNQKKATGSCYLVDALDQKARKKADIFIYQNRNLAEVFKDCLWYVGGKKEWRNNFDILWPDREKIRRGKVQNYGNMKYYKAWNEWTRRSTEEAVSDAKAELWKVFRTVYWLPYAQSDRVWDSRLRRTEKFQKSSGISADSPAPKVMVYKKKPEWVSSLLFVSFLREI